MKTWLITGASSGLGRVMTERLLESGDTVIATVRRETALSGLPEKYGDRLRVLVVDLTQVPSMRAQIDSVFAQTRIDFVVSNAGYGLFGAIEEATDEQVERQIATNLTGSMRFVRAVLPHLRRQGGGRIIQVSSEGGQTTYPGFGFYHASKWGIEGFIETLASEVGVFGIECMIVEPGPTGTGFAGNLDRAPELGDYATSPVSDVRRSFTDGSFAVRGDVERTVKAMIEAALAEKLPLRLALGSAAFDRIAASLDRRLSELRSQQQIAYTADA